MAQFKVNPAIKIEANKIGNIGKKINDSFINVNTGEIEGCNTADLYNSEIQEIKKVFSLYSQLVEKDMKDIEGFFFVSNLLDNILSKKYK